MIQNPYRPSRRSVLGMFGAALLSPVQVRAAGLEVASGTAFGTTWQIVGASGSGLEALRPEVVSLFASIDARMSPWRPDSALSRINSGQAGRQEVDDEFVFVAGRALDVARDSGGAFDPTVGPIVARWGFGPIAGGEIPNWRGIEVGAGMVGKDRDDLTLDLCGIAKGRAVDQALDLASAAGFDDLLFDVGGELRALGRHPSGRVWRVAVEGAGPDVPAALRLPPGRAVATSGMAAQSYTLGGHTYGHIIDAAARAPADRGLRSVSVVADDAMTADAWATALFAAGPAAGGRLARDRGIAAYFLLGNGAEPRHFGTGDFETLLLREDSR